MDRRPGDARQPVGEARGHPAPHLDAHKKTLAARERDEAARQQWRAVAADLDVNDLVVVDEAGTQRAMTPLQAWAPRGVRAVGTVPRHRGTVTTLLAARSLAGMGAAMTIEGGTDSAVFSAVFEAYIEQGLAPTVRPGQIVVLDNVGAHQSERARQAIAARGCRVLFLPAYSPDLAPIELAFSKLKASLRRVEARTQAALEEAIGDALRTITPADPRGWFAHCGFSLPAQPL